MIERLDFFGGDYFFTIDFKNETTDLATNFYPAHRLTRCNPPWLFPNPFSSSLLDEDEDTGGEKAGRTDEERSEKLFPCKVPRGLARGYEILMAHKM